MGRTAQVQSLFCRTICTPVQEWVSVWTLCLVDGCLMSRFFGCCLKCSRGRKSGKGKNSRKRTARGQPTEGKGSKRGRLCHYQANAAPCPPEKPPLPACASHEWAKMSRQTRFESQCQVHEAARICRQKHFTCTMIPHCQRNPLFYTPDHSGDPINKTLSLSIPFYIKSQYIIDFLIIL